MTSSSVSCESKLNGSIASYRTNFFGGFRSSQASATSASLGTAVPAAESAEVAKRRAQRAAAAEGKLRLAATRSASAMSASWLFA